MFTYQSDLTIGELESVINQLCPVRLIINHNVVWNDEKDDLHAYNQVMEEHSQYVVTELTFIIVDHHHSVVKITAKSGED